MLVLYIQLVVVAIIQVSASYAHIYAIRDPAEMPHLQAMLEATKKQLAKSQASLDKNTTSSHYKQLCESITIQQEKCNRIKVRLEKERIINYEFKQQQYDALKAEFMRIQMDERLQTPEARQEAENQYLAECGDAMTAFCRSKGQAPRCFDLENAYKVELRKLNVMSAARMRHQQEYEELKSRLVMLNDKLEVISTCIERLKTTNLVDRNRPRWRVNLSDNCRTQ